MAIKLIQNGKISNAKWLGLSTAALFVELGLENLYYKLAANGIYSSYTSTGMKLYKDKIIVAKVPLTNKAMDELEHPSSIPEELKSEIKNDIKIACSGLVEDSLPKFNLSGHLLSENENITVHPTFEATVKKKSLNTILHMDMAAGSGKSAAVTKVLLWPDEAAGIPPVFPAYKTSLKELKEGTYKMTTENNKALAKQLPKVPLLEASAIYQKVNSTGQNSVYFYLANFKKNLRVAVRRNQNLSIRVEGDGIHDPEYSAALVAFGMSKSDSGKHYSVHFNVGGDISTTCKTFGALLAMLGIENMLECGDIKNVEESK